MSPALSSCSPYFAPASDPPVGIQRSARGSQRLRVLIVAHVDRLAARLDRSQYYRYAALARHPGVTLFGPGLADYQPGMSVSDAIDVAYGGTSPDVIVHGMDFKESGVPLLTGLPESNALTALELQDSWTVPEQQTAFINRQQFDLGLLIVRHHIPFYRAQCPQTEFLWTPHAVNTSLFHDYGLPKEYDVLLYGNLTPHTYPFRARLADLLTRSDLRVRCIGHPGYYPQHQPESSDSITGADLSREINRAWITISTSSIYRCVMMKYYEIAVSRSLIAGDMPDEGREIFGNDFLELSPQQSNAEILRTIKECLADKDCLTAMTDAAHRRIMRDFHTDTFAVRLLNQLRTFVDRHRASAGMRRKHAAVHTPNKFTSV